MSQKIYPEVKQLNLPEIDKQILQFWNANNTFEQSIETRKDAEPFVFFEGPPSANGMPGIHHVMSRTLKDLFCRYQTLKGKKVERKGGWDTHGLPIELAVEKRLGINKEHIGVKISVADYNAECRKEVLKFKEAWDDLTRKMGYWVDLENPYITYENSYIETLWWILKQFYNKGLLYKGYTIQPYSPAAGTGLSSHELNLPGCYRNVKDTSATVQFKITDPSLTLPKGERTGKPGYITADPTTYKLLRERQLELRNNPTEAENLLWKFLKAHGADEHFRRQHIVGNFIPDFVCLKKKLVVEVDGGIHRKKDVAERDEDRTQALNEMGYKVIRFTNEEIFNNIEVVVSKIKDELKVLPIGEDLGGVEGLEGEVFFLAWTTTPWTLPSNCALAVGANIEYVLVKTFNPYTFMPVNVILAKDLLGKYFKPENENLPFENFKAGDKEIPYQIVASYKGSDLAGIRYEQLLPFVQPESGDNFKVVVGDFVSTEDGTGIVHIAPSFGADDMRVGKQNGVGALTLVDKRGKFLPEVKDNIFLYGEEFVKEAYLTEAEKQTEFEKQKKILEANGKIKELKSYLSVDDRIVLKLQEENKLFKKEKYEHNYPHCWRTDKPILYYPLDSWFIKTTAIKERMVELNKTINWKPESTGTGRFGNWLENLVDWNLSRSRYWGTPLPIWRTEDGTEEICIGSVEELNAEIEKSIEAGFLKSEIRNQKSEIDLHKPFVDEIILVSPSGKKMFREPDLIDVWFDSGAMPYAQWHYPFENKEVFEKSFPADFISEGVDQTRGWFFTLHAIGTMLMDSVAFKNVVSNGLVLDKNGNKMSKRLGNTVEPFETIAKYGADATRWYMITNAQPWDNLKFDINGIGEVQRKFFGTLFNTYSFFSLYANIDGFQLNEQNIIPVKNRPEIDRWIISKLNTLIKEVDGYYADYEPTKAGRAVQDFVDEHLSNWYVRLCRRRFWKGEMNEDKQAAYETLFECLIAISQLMSPVAPFFADWLYQNLTNNLREKNLNTKFPFNSVHLSHFITADESLIDENLNYSMQLAQEASSLILSLRKKANIKVRQPLSKVLIPSQGDSFEKHLLHVSELIKSEVNVKQIDLVRDLDFAKKKIKPNFRNLGKIFGKEVPKVVEILNAASQQQLNDSEKTGIFPLILEGKQHALMSTEFEIITEDIPGWEVAGSDLLTVALDITISEELKNEGNARELVNRIQNLRKEKDFNVTDRISIRVEQNPAINDALNNYKNYICTEVLAEQLIIEELLEQADVVEVNENPVKLIIERKNQ